MTLLSKETLATPVGVPSARTAAAAVDGAAYPRARDLLAIDAWLQRTGGPGAGPALLVTGRAAYVPTPATPRPGRLALRQEVLTPAAAVALGGRSARLFLTLDCAARTAILESAEVHPGPGLTGPAHQLAPARWRRVDPETEAADFVLLACGPLRAASDETASSISTTSVPTTSAAAPSALTPSASQPGAPASNSPTPSATPAETPPPRTLG